jgi:hypothetical protein
MLKGLQRLVGKTASDGQTKKPAGNAAPKPPSASNDFRAVLVTPGNSGCFAANAIADKRFLFREAPRLPLVDCTMAPDCSCKFKKLSDRRDRDRRESGETEANRRFTGPENRKGAGRRSAKT